MATSTKTPSATPASIESRRAAVAAAKARLQQTQAALAAAERAAQAKAQAQARKDDTRRKLLLGAMLIADTATDAQAKAYADGLAQQLTRAQDRALFGLDPLPAAAPAQPQEQPQDDASTPTQEQNA
jgi:DNA repair exonuclease SbcCD ATPase subunit